MPDARVIATAQALVDLATSAFGGVDILVNNAGVHALTRNLAIELAPLHIRINTVAPGVVETPVYNTFMSDDEVKATLPPAFNAFHPLGRNGQPRDVAEAILFLASDAAGWITGTVLPVDGGVMAGRHA
ncbi:sugar dehydrogenase [Pandoraea capi]|uniref:Sugar dehydrogenase n=1 Tax=Pandoraea capi TaxID=2508286 RepID=A0ABY6VVL9_9BURK|nr:SDR family oxidoreductase [Pandoraea capi]VVD93688.1 sugar dehydrogenase [Pandoraea capi]